MALKRKLYQRRRVAKRKRTMNISRPRPVYKRQHRLNVTKTFHGFNWTPSTTTTGDFWKYITVGINNLPELSSYQAVFETYRINSIKYTLRPRYDSFAGNDTTDTTLPGVTNQGGNDVHVIIDPKSQLTPTGAYSTSTLNNFLSNGKVRTYRGMKPISFTVKYPCIADDVNGVAGAKVIRAGFMDLNSATAVQHRGAHVYINDINHTGVFGQSYDVFLTLNVTFQGMR